MQAKHNCATISPPFIVRLRVTPTYRKEVVAKAGYNISWYF